MLHGQQIPRNTIQTLYVTVCIVCLIKTQTMVSRSPTELEKSCMHAAHNQAGGFQVSASTHKAMTFRAGNLVYVALAQHKRIALA